MPVACSMALFGYFVQVRHGATCQRPMVPAPLVTIASFVGGGLATTTADGGAKSLASSSLVIVAAYARDDCPALICQADDASTRHFAPTAIDRQGHRFGRGRHPVEHPPSHRSAVCLPVQVTHESASLGLQSHFGRPSHCLLSFTSGSQY